MTHNIKNIIVSKTLSLENTQMLKAFLYGYIRVDNMLIPLIHKSKMKTISKDQIHRSDSSSYMSSLNNSVSWENTTTTNPVLPQFPEFVYIKEVSLGSFSHTTVITKRPISRGTVIGLYTGEKLHPKDRINTTVLPHVWEVVVKGQISFALDGSKDPYNWMKYISHARNTLEQNVDVVYIEKSDELIFQVNRDIENDVELLAWYPWKDWLLMLLDLISPVPLKSIENQKILADRDSNSLDASACKEKYGDTGEFVCLKCGGVFNYKYYLDRHKKYTSCIDSGDRKHVCQLCNRTFQKAERLRVHTKQVHDKIKPYKCSVCRKEFSQSSSLTKHLRIHTGDRPYKCLECGKEFTASSILTTHMRQHTGEKPFKCKICKRGFASHAAHHSHARRSHGIEPREMRSMTLEENNS